MSSQVDIASDSRPDVRQGAKALVTAANRVLLVKETHADGSAFWTLPGGGVEPNESTSAALHRELAEELRCDAAIERLRASFWYAHSSCDRAVTRYTVFDCRLVSPPTPNPAEGILETAWVRPSSLPPRTLLPVRNLLKTHFCRSTAEWLRP